MTRVLSPEHSPLPLKSCGLWALAPIWVNWLYFSHSFQLARSHRLLEDEFASEKLFHQSYALSVAFLGAFLGGKGAFSMFLGKLSRTFVRRFSSTPVTNDLLVSDKALERLATILKEEEGKGQFLRVLVESGGCYGFQYKLRLDNHFQKDRDLVVSEKPDAKVVVDKLSLELVDGAQLDYVESLLGSSFQILNNPKANSGCGCGSSFEVKL